MRSKYSEFIKISIVPADRLQSVSKPLQNDPGVVSFRNKQNVALLLEELS